LRLKQSKAVCLASLLYCRHGAGISLEIETILTYNEYKKDIESPRGWHLA
jgi:hypothetical protein